MDMFPEAALVRHIQKQLDDIIQEGVRNITRLIRVSETAATESAQKQNNRPTGGQSKSAQHQDVTIQTGPRPRVKSIMDKSLAGRLVRDGLLTPDLLQQLQKEWSEKQNSNFATQSSPSTIHNENHSGGTKRKKKWRGNVCSLCEHWLQHPFFFFVKEKKWF